MAGDEPTAVNPVVWSALVVPSKTRAGAEIVFEVRARMAAGWTVHSMGAPDLAVDSSVPTFLTTLRLELPAGIEAIGDWELPTARRLIDRPSVGAVYEGDATFRRRLKIAERLPSGTMGVECEIGFQACDANFCRRPEMLTVAVTIDVVE